jgi:hypothetical protein
MNAGVGSELVGDLRLQIAVYDIFLSRAAPAAEYWLGMATAGLILDNNIVLTCNAMMLNIFPILLMTSPEVATS